MPKMKRSGTILAAACVVLVIGFFVVQHLLDPDTYRAQIESTLSGSLGRIVKLGHLDLSLFSGSLVAEAPSISDDPAFSPQPFLAAKDVRIGVEILPFLLHRTIHITGFTIDQPKIILVRADNGTWNYSSLGGENRRAPNADTNSLLPNLTVGAIDIKGGQVTMSAISKSIPPHIYSNLNVSVKSFSFASAFPFTVSGDLPAGGSLSITGTAGPINQHDASLTPLTAQVSMKHADLLQAGLVTPEQGITGIVDFDLKAVSNGQTAQADGTLHLTQLKLAKNGSPSSQPVDVQFSVNQNLQTLTGTIQSAKLLIGKAALSLSGAYQTVGAVTTVQLNANGQTMPVNELLAFLPSLGVQLPSGSRLQGGTLSLTLAVSGSVAAPTVTGPVKIENTQLAGFDLGQKLSSISMLTGAKTGSATTIQNLSTTLHYGPNGTQTNDLSLIVSGIGSATGSGSISPGGALNYHLLIKPGAEGVGAIATQALGMLGSVVSQGTQNGIPVSISGTTSNPAFAPDMDKLFSGATQKNSPAGSLGGVLGGLFKR